MSGSKTDDTTSDSRSQNTKDRFRLLGMVRLVAIKLTSGGTWQAIGNLLLDQSTEETIPAANFSGVGFFARPPAGANCEAILASPSGDAEGHVIVATRDEDTRKKMANIDQDETIMYTSKSSSKIAKTGTVRTVVPVGKFIEATDTAGVAQKIPTLDDFNALVGSFNALVAAYNSHQHGVLLTAPTTGTTVAPLSTPGSAAGAPTGTIVFKAY